MDGGNEYIARKGLFYIGLKSTLNIVQIDVNN